MRRPGLPCEAGTATNPPRTAGGEKSGGQGGDRAGRRTPAAPNRSLAPFPASGPGDQPRPRRADPGAVAATVNWPLAAACRPIHGRFLGGSGDRVRRRSPLALIRAGEDGGCGLLLAW